MIGMLALGSSGLLVQLLRGGGCRSCYCQKWNDGAAVVRSGEAAVIMIRMLALGSSGLLMQPLRGVGCWSCYCQKWNEGAAVVRSGEAAVS
jgi:hypothetical protein